MIIKRNGFTLIEILIAVMLTGLISTLALAPVIVTVRRVVDIQNDYTDIAALSRTLNFITRDISSAMRLASEVLIIKEHESLGGNDDDALIILTTAPVAQNLPAGSIAYKLENERRDIIPGLYRWIFPGKLPSDIDPETLNPEDAQLVLPDVKNFCVEVVADSVEKDRRKDYKGSLPVGIYMRISRSEKDKLKNNSNSAGGEKNQDERDSIESFIVLP